MNSRIANIYRVAVAILAAVAVMSCGTMVTIETQPEDARVYLNQRPLGEAPVDVELSNFVGNSYQVRIERDGYETIRTDLQKEVKVGNLIVGLILVWPLLLWTWGPQPYQYYELEEEPG